MLKITLIAAAAVSMMAGAASAAPLYDNGPLNGNLDGFTISSGYSVADSFTALDGSTVSSVDFAAFLFPTDTMQTVDWTISSGNPFDGGTTIASGTSATAGTFLFNDNYGYDIDNESFSVGAVTLTGGDYYLSLANVTTAQGNDSYWDENNGPSAAFQNGNGLTNYSLANYDIPGTTGSETFSINGTAPAVSAAPEPGTWALMFGGLAMIGGMLRIANARRRENEVAGIATA